MHPILARLEGVGWLTSRWEDIDPSVEGRPGWGHVHTIYRDPTDDYANSVTQQTASGGMGGPGGNGP